MIKGEPIYILLVEDDPAHSEAVRRALKVSGMNVVVREAGTLRAYRELAAAHPPDIAILDLCLPDGRAVEVLISPPEAGPFPIVVITGQGDELLAVEAMKAGALDYIVKSPEAFAGMPRTVERVLHEWDIRQERMRMEEALRESKERYRILFETMAEGVVLIAPDGQIVQSNPAAERILGLNRLEIEGRQYDSSKWELLRPDGTPMPPEEMAGPRAMRGKHSVKDVVMGAKSPDGFVSWINVNAVPILDQAGEIESVVGTFQDITERKQAEEALRETEEKLSLFVRYCPNPVYIKDEDTRAVVLSHHFEKMLGKPLSQLLGKTDEELWPPELAAAMRADDEKVMKEGCTIGREETFEGRYFFSVKFPILIPNRPTLLGGYTIDITERKRTEEALRRAEENFRCTLDDSPLGVRIVTAEGETIYANRAILDIYGYDSIEELKTTPVKNRYTPESYAEFQIRHNKRQQGEEAPSEYEISIVKKNGEVRHLQVFRKEVLWNGERQYQALYRDITDRRRADEALRASLREKEILLREIHHRVKNNMQIISSLFNLQAGYIKDEEALRILKEGQTRIRSMALVHEKLYQSGDLSKIDLAGYIQSLSVHLFHVYLVDPNQVRLETEFEEVPLDINSAVPCGLILNELISNALKHAFPAGRKGVLTIRLRRRKDGAVELRIADNGVGFPEGLDFRRTESLGLQIVSLLVGQLEGTIKLAGKNGTAFTVAFHELK
jgi:PAS domain S-box-containing protein